MLYLVAGNVGTGKTYQQMIEISKKLCSGANVISNIEFFYDKFLAHYVKEKEYKKVEFGKFIFRPYLDPEFLVRYAKKYHDLRTEAPENQTLIIMDESTEYFNNREWNTRKDRKSWIEFIQHHRKLKYTFVLIVQDWEDIDVKIKRKAEYIEEHRLVNNAGGPSFILNMLKIKLFLTITTWRDTPTVVKKEYFKFNKLYGSFYNTNQLLHEMNEVSKRYENEPLNVPEIEAQKKQQEVIRAEYEENRKTLKKQLKKYMSLIRQKYSGCSLLELHPLYVYSQLLQECYTI